LEIVDVAVNLKVDQANLVPSAAQRRGNQLNS
jgi:hypothetical protein